jgi:tripartite ATP-independent transporter DctP family solute receptor
MSMLTRRSFIRTTAAVGAGLVFAPAIIGRAQAQTTLTVASLLGDDKPETLIWHRIRDLVEQKLPGQFNFNIVGNAALGGEKEVAEGIRLGSVQASLSTVSALSGWVPEVQLLDLPFLFRDAAHVRATVTGETGAELKEKLAAQNFVVADFINYGARHLLTKELVTRPGQLSGKRIRVIQSPLHTRLWSAFGATPVGVPIPETYNALRTGLADAMDLTKSAYAGFRLYEVVPYLTETGHIWASGVVYFAAQFWNGLEDEQRQVFQEAASEGAVHFNELIVIDEERSMALATEHGGKVLQPDDRAAWEEGAHDVWQDFADIVGGRDKIESIRDAG